MKRRVIASLLTLVLCLTLLPAPAFAADTGEDTPEPAATDIYVSSAGDDTAGNGSQSAPYATLAKAVDEATDGTTIYVMSNLTMTKCARFYSKSLTITSLGDATYTITRGDNFAQQQDNARSTYNPAMIEVQTNGDKPAGLTLTNIILDDAGKHEGTVFAQAVSDDGTGTSDTSQNAVYVQDAIIASNATVPSTITLGDGAVLRNFGGMSAVRVTNRAQLVMKSGSVIEDTLSGYTRSKGTDTRSVGPAGAVWLQGGSLEMENGAKIKNINGRAVYADGGSVSVGGTISGITGNANMWQGKDGTAIHLRGSAKATLNGKISDCTEGVLVFVDKAVFEMATGSFLGNSNAAGIKTNEDPKWSDVDKADFGTDRNIITINGEITGIQNSKHPIQFKYGTLTIGESGYVHDNAANYGALYIQRDAVVHIYGKINNNVSAGRGGGIGTAGHGFVEINLYKGAEIKDNIANNTGGGLSLKNTKFVMHGGKISGNRSNNNVGGGVYLYKDVVVELHGGTISGNIDKNGSNDITITDSCNSTSENNYLAISNDITIGNKAIYFEKDTKTVTPAEDIKLGNASADSKATLKTASNGNGWADPFATFWAQRNGGAELTVGGLTPLSSLPVYALVQETGEDGKPASGAEVRVYSTEMTAAGIRLTLPNGYANGCAVALAQPTTDFGTVVITTMKPELQETADLSGGAYEVPYTVTYTMSDSLLNMLKTASADITTMSFVVELDSRLAAKTGDSGNCLYTFDGDGILNGTASISGHTVTVTCAPLSGWKTAITGKSSVKMTLQCAGLLDAAAFAAGESLNTAAHISGKVSSGSTVTSVVIPSNICRTKMLAPTYTVTYDANGGSGTMTDKKSPYAYGAAATVLTNGFTRSGYTFTGWNTKADGKGTSCKAGDTINVIGNIILYAQWSKNSSGRDDRDSYYFAIEKIDAQDSHALNGATFALYQYSSDGKTVNRTTAKTSRNGSESGIALFSVDSITGNGGDWYYVEVTAPEGYVLDTTEHKITKNDFSTSRSAAIRNAETVRNYRSSTPDVLNGDDHYAYVVGYSDGAVRPNANISRAEVATIFFRLLKDSVRDGNLLTSNTYTDVPDSYWANTAISTMTGLGYVQGRSTTTFAPQSPITRAEFATICARFDTGKSSGTQTFSDIKGHWAQSYIERAAELGWIKGFEDGTFRPDTYITRAQAMTMINRVLNRIPEDASDLLPDMNVWPDCNPGDWFYLAVQEATNSHNYKHKAGNYETWISMKEDPDWTRYEN